MALYRVRHEGVGALIQQVRDAPNHEDHAAVYVRWVARNTPGPDELSRMADGVAALAWQPRISVVTPVYNTDPRYLRACIESVRAQVYPHWELCLCDDASQREDTRAVLREYDGDARIKVRFLDRNSNISAASNGALEMATGDYIALLDHDDELTPDALFHVAAFLNAQPGADMVYSDEDKLDTSGGRCDPYFKPDWSPEHFLGTMYTCHLMVVRHAVLKEIGGFREGYEGAQDYDVVLRLMERTDRIHHLPRILYHWRKLAGSAASANAAKPWALDAGRRALEDRVRRNGGGAEVHPGAAPGLFRIKYAVRDQPLVSILIPTRGTGPLLARCVRSIAAHTTEHRIEVIVVADGPLAPDARAALEPMRARILDYRAPGPFNFSHKINAAAAAAAGDHLLLLNDDVEVIEDGWLAAMLEYSQQEPIGAVGAKLLYPDDSIQHAGIILGVRGVAAHAFHQHRGESAGYASSAVRVGNFSAVSGACMMTRRDVFRRAGGFDETFPTDFNDVDYCLRLGRLGYRIVFTPYARLVHHESATFGARMPDPAGAAEMRRRWGPVIEADPYYHPNLTREFPDYRLR